MADDRGRLVNRPHMRNLSINEPYSPRLLTPEQSSTGEGSTEPQNSPARGRNGPAVVDLLTSRGLPTDRRPHQTSPKHSIPKVDMRNDRNESRPYSPPYRANEDQKPSLPPLKMVLADAMTSPPETPKVESATLQPSPREPNVVDYTFKPAAFYPNKKPRTDLDAHSSWPNAKFSFRPNSPVGPNNILDPQQQRQPANLSCYPSPNIVHVSATSHRRHSLQPGYPLARTNLTNDSSFQFQASPPGLSTTQLGGGNWVRFSGEARDSDSIRISTTSESFSLRPNMSALPRRLPENSTQDFSRSAYPPTPFCVSRPPFLPLDDIRMSMMPERGHVFPRRDDCHRASARPYPDNTRRDSVCLSPPAYRDTYHHRNQPTSFLPAHYDYQPGKTRKRSNLPKQSTEIMRSWFEQNITNPYPSEEQKAVFSNATGISMTQVSNWFINHRRRCPELREKRERIRAGGGMND